MEHVCSNCKMWCEYANKVRMGTCDHPAVRIGSYEPDSPDGIACDECMFTGPYFGCIHFTPKDGES